MSQIAKPKEATADGTVKKTPARKPAAKKSTAPKPRTASLFKSMDLATIDIETAGPDSLVVPGEYLEVVITRRAANVMQ